MATLADAAKKKALVIAYKHFNSDPRIIREMNSLLDNGYAIDHVCVNLNETDDIVHKQGKLNVYTINMHRKRGSLFRYLYEYASFFIFVLLRSTQLMMRNRYAFVLIFTMPEPLVFTAFFAKVRGVPVLMDWEDPLYELFLTKFSSKKYFVLRWIVLFLERLSVLFVNHIVTPNSAFKDAFIARGYRSDKIDIVLNAPDNRVFSSSAYKENSNIRPHSILYNGSIFHRHGLDLGLQAVALVKKQFPDVILTIIGEGEIEYVEFCRQKIVELGLEENVEWHSGVGIREMPGFYNNTSIAIIPNRKIPFTNINFPQRIFECGIMRKPAVVSKLHGIEAYMPEESVQYVEPDNVQSIADGISILFTDKQKYRSIVENAFRICTTISWEDELHAAIATAVKTRRV